MKKRYDDENGKQLNFNFILKKLEAFLNYLEAFLNYHSYDVEWSGGQYCAKSFEIVFQCNINLCMTFYDSDFIFQPSLCNKYDRFFYPIVFDHILIIS